jgi:hypothetical protein
MPVLVDATEAIASVYVEAAGGSRPGDRWGQREQRPGVRDSLVRPVGIVELLELAQGVQEVPLVPDQGPVKQLAAAGLHPALHDRIHSRHLDPAEHRLDPGVLEHGAKQAGELAVAVPDQEPRPAPGILEIHDEVLRGLGHPAGSGVRGGAQDPDPSAGVLDDRQHVDAGAAQGDRLEEVAGEQGPGLGAEEVSPGGGGALGCRVDPGLLKDLPDGGGGDLDPEDEQFAVDAAVAPERKMLSSTFSALGIPADPR